MADPRPLSGATLSIGGVVAAQAADFVAADFSGEVWVDIDGLETLGEFGDSANEIRTDFLNRGRTVKQKGTRDAGTMDNQIVIIPSDVGQTAAIAAEQTSDSYAFRVTYDDAPNPGTPTTVYFIGLVNSFRQLNGGSDSVRIAAMQIGLNSNIVTVAAASS